MSANGTDDPTEGGKLIAAEYVLGVLGAEERREVERRLAQEPALASEVAFWEQRLMGLADTVAAVTPPPTTWSRIEAAIDAPAADRARPPSPAWQPATMWQSLAFWRSFGIASATLAAASIAALAYIGLVPSARAPLMATLGGAGGQPNFVATVAATGNRLVLVPAALLTNDPRAMQLWLIPAGEARPHSLGLVLPGQPIALDIPRDLAGRLTPDATLAISLEPPGGSPTGLPTGPVIASGKLANL
jgi:anti-sigma-K factor RskA